MHGVTWLNSTVLSPTPCATSSAWPALQTQQERRPQKSQDELLSNISWSPSPLWRIWSPHRSVTCHVTLRPIQTCIPWQIWRVTFQQCKNNNSRQRYLQKWPNHACAPHTTYEHPALSSTHTHSNQIRLTIDLRKNVGIANNKWNSREGHTQMENPEICRLCP